MKLILRGFSKTDAGVATLYMSIATKQFLLKNYTPKSVECFFVSFTFCPMDKEF